jgi:hypothetical protein
MLTIILTFLLTTAFYGVLLYLACRRVSRHLQGNESAIHAVTTHLLLPLLGRRPEDENDQPAGEPDSLPYSAAPKNGQPPSRTGGNHHEQHP